MSLPPPGRRAGDGLRLALTTLTVARVRRPAVLDRRTAGTAMSLAPVVGALLAVLASGVLAAFAAVSDGALLPATAAVVALAALTRGLHLDGLADTADGLGSYLPAEQARRIMKAPDIGALGVATVVLVLVVQIAALAACQAAGRGVPALVLAVTLARVVVSGACTSDIPAAAPDGMGALVAGTVRAALPALTGVVAVAAIAGWQQVADGPGAALRVAVAAGIGLLAAGVLLRHVVRRLGGITGDVLGALVEVTSAGILVGMALHLPR